MPELPEVETTRRGILPHAENHIISEIIIRDYRLRWPVPDNLPRLMKLKIITAIQRRGKYLIFNTSGGYLLLHLGMSGSLRIADQESEIRKHDHVDIILDNGKILRYHDPRRFGCLLYIENNPEHHALLSNLGVEPLGAEFDGNYLFSKSRKRTIAVKNFIMDSHIVTGVGNIYASEALFLAKIRPTRSAGKVTLKEYELLAKMIKKTLNAAIKQGGTTLRDFVREDGNPGYFKQELNVYDRKNQPCKQCGEFIKLKVIAQRASYYCPLCQR